MVASHLEDAFPGLHGRPYEITSRKDERYNCVAWAAGDDQNWWWPDENEEDRWPDGVARSETVEAFRDAFATLGYAACDNDQAEVGYEKVAVFALAGAPKHATRQLPTGRWTSKLGLVEDIEHDLHDLAGSSYGLVVLIMKRRLPA
jgi:hypothetical protein